VRFRSTENPIKINALQALHQIGTVISFREYGPAENDFWYLGAKAVFSQTLKSFKIKEKSG
jgi:ribosomal protein S19E (S16A)